MFTTQNVLSNTKLKYIYIAIISMVAVFFLSTAKAHAATLTVATGTDSVTVDSSCSLSEAIQNINDQAQTNTDCAAGDGNNDTINIPAGTITLSNDLDGISNSVNIVGAGKSQTIIDADGFIGFHTNAGSYDFVFQDFTMENASPYGLNVLQANTAVVQNVDIGSSENGALVQAINVVINNSIIHDNTGDHGGLTATAYATSSGDDTSVLIADSQIINNTINSGQSESGGLSVKCSGTSPVNSETITIDRTTIAGNIGHMMSGLSLNCAMTSPLLLTVDSVTISDNSTIVDQGGNVTHAFDAQPVASGTYFIVGNLVPGMQFTNVTVANNTMTNTLNNRVSMAGFLGTVVNGSEQFNLTNTSVVNNNVTQTNPHSELPMTPAFIIANVGGSGVTGTGGSARNSLISRNNFNGTTFNCIPDFPASLFGGSGTLDMTPTDLGNNIDDDGTCTGFTTSSSLYSTLGPLQDNGGSVETIALLPGSPAIGGGGHVLGISTDARGIARPNTPDIGAYQSVLGASTDSGSGTAAAGGSLGDTGTSIKLVALVAAVGFTASAVVLFKKLALKR